MQSLTFINLAKLLLEYSLNFVSFTLCPIKNDTDVGCYNFDICQLILIIFAEMLQRVCYQMVVLFPNHLTVFGALPGKM